MDTSVIRTVTPQKTFQLKEPASAITHFTAMVSAVVAAPFLLARASLHGDMRYLVSCFLFILSMVLLYGASTSYHAIVAKGRTMQRLKKLDHMMIYFLIAGSYTPVCLLVLPERQGSAMCLLVWGIAVAGFVLTALWVDSPKWLNSSIYIAMGWLCIFAIRTIYACMPHAAFLWLLTGGIIYTIGGVIYALKLPVFRSLCKGFGNHEIFHLFVMGGSFCHFIMVYAYLC